MAFGRGHAAFTIDTLKLQKESLPATVNEPPPVFPELIHTPHPLVENPSSEYDYKLQLKSNFITNFRSLHDPKNENQYRLNLWKEDWSLLPRELKIFSNSKKTLKPIKPNLSGKKSNKEKKVKNLRNITIDLDKYKEKTADEDRTDDEDQDETNENEENLEIDENDVDGDGKLKSLQKKKLTDNDDNIDGDVPEEEEDMDFDEAADYFESHFDPGDRDDDLEDDGGDGYD